MQKRKYLFIFFISQGKFQIDPDTGVMNVSGLLNREENSFYMLIIEAWDNYQFGYITGESRNAFKQIGSVHKIILLFYFNCYLDTYNHCIQYKII